MQEESAGRNIIWLPIEAIKVDARYQRKINRVRTKAIVDEFKWIRFGVLHVNKRDGFYWAMDGSHRLEAARRLGHRKVPCLIYQVPYAEEAQLFYFFNVNRGPVPGVDVFRDRLQWQEANAVEIAQVVNAHGFTLSLRDGKGSHGGNPYEINAVGALERIFKYGGSERLGVCLRILKAAHQGDPAYLAGQLIGGLARFVEVYDGKFREDRLIHQLSITPSQNMKNRAAYYAGTGHPYRYLCWAIMILERYNERLRSGRLSPESLYRSAELPDDKPEEKPAVGMMF